MNSDIELYKNKIAKLHCARINGKLIIAKPALLLAIIYAIEDKSVVENKFYWDSTDRVFKKIQEYYKSIYQGYAPNEYMTPIFKPFYHLRFDGIWHLKTTDNCRFPSSATSGFLKEHLEYAFLDEAFWHLLHGSESRDTIKDILVNNYIKSY